MWIGFMWLKIAHMDISCEHFIAYLGSINVGEMTTRVTVSFSRHSHSWSWLSSCNHFSEFALYLISLS